MSNCSYCLKKFSRADSRKRHEKTCKVKEYLNPRQIEPTSPLLGPEVTSPRPTEPASPVETVKPSSPTDTIESAETAQVDVFGDPMTPEEIANNFPEAPTSPVKMEDEVEDPWEVFRDRVKALNLKDFKHLVKTLRKEGVGKKLAKVRAYNQMLPELRKRSDRSILTTCNGFMFCERIRYTSPFWKPEIV